MADDRGGGPMIEGDARLAFRPVDGRGPSEGVDEPLGLDRGGPLGRDGVLYVPDTVSSRPPLLVFLHGAGGSGRRELRLAYAAADRYGVVVAAPDSRAPTWDMIAGGYGPDVAFIDHMLNALVDRVDFDGSKLAVGGVSDGASYALSLGLTNGDVFGAIIAFSPGFAAPTGRNGTPRVFVSHGTADTVLPIDMCSRRIVPSLAEAGCHVTYAEFDGGHTVPPEIADRGLRWLVDGFDQNG
jgi:phospholipase/carboxylesterase